MRLPRTALPASLKQNMNRYTAEAHPVGDPPSWLVPQPVPASPASRRTHITSRPSLDSSACVFPIGARSQSWPRTVHQKCPATSPLPSQPVTQPSSKNCRLVTRSCRSPLGEYNHATELATNSRRPNSSVGLSSPPRYCNRSSNPSSPICIQAARLSHNFHVTQSVTPTHPTSLATLSTLPCQTIRAN
jgi:hypothetical protein